MYDRLRSYKTTSVSQTGYHNQINVPCDIYELGTKRTHALDTIQQILKTLYI